MRKWYNHGIKGTRQSLDAIHLKHDIRGKLQEIIHVPNNKKTKQA